MLFPLAGGKQLGIVRYPLCLHDKESPLLSLSKEGDAGKNTLNFDTIELSEYTFGNLLPSFSRMVGIEKSAIHADAKLPEHQDDKTYQLKTSEEIRKAIFPDGIPAQPQEDGGDNVPVGAEAKEAFGISVELTGEGVAGALIKAGLRLGDKNGATFTIKEKRKLDDGTIGLEFFMKQFQGVNLDPLNVPGGKGFVKIEDVTFEQSTQLSEVDKQKKWTVLITKKDGKFAMHIAPMKEGFEPSAKLTVTGKGPKDLTVSLAPDGKKLIFKDKAGTVVTEASLENVQVVGSTATQYIYVQNKRWQLDLKNAKNQLEVKITPVE